MNWQEFLTNNNIDFVTRGPNTKRGEISVQCPFCGDEDPSQHLGINLETSYWGCLRNAEHRGQSPVKLIAALLRCNYSVAKATFGQYAVSDPDDLQSVIDMLSGHFHAEYDRKEEEAPETRTITTVRSTLKFWKYLEGRGFNPQRIIKEYKLTCCVTGRFKDRIIIPYYHGGEVIAWSGRAIINPITAPRYLSSNAVKSTVFNFDDISKGGEMLFITEGPFDAINMDYHSKLLNVRATCVSGTTITVPQLALIRGLKSSYRKIVMLFDNDAADQAYSAADWLGAEIGHLPDGFKDPGELYQSQVDYLVGTHGGDFL